MSAGGAFEAGVQATDSGAIAGELGDRVTVKLPEKPGIYRLYVYVTDGKGQAATANAPFEVR